MCGCVFRVAAAAHALRTYFTTYLHILKPSCNIASQASAVVCCRSHQFCASLSFMCNLFVWLTSSFSDHLSWATSCPCVTECISYSLLYILHRLEIRNAAGLFNKLKAFTAPLCVRLHKRLRLEQLKLPRGLTIAQLLSLLCLSRSMPL